MTKYYLGSTTPPVGFTKFANRFMYSWNPLFNKIMDLKDEAYEAWKRTSSIEDFYAVLEYNSTVDRWMYLSKDPFWNSIRPFLRIKQDGDIVLFRYEKLIAMYSKAEEYGFTSGEDVWHAWDNLLQYARSITINIRDETIVTCPFDKFFNIGEVEESSWEYVTELMSHAKSCGKNIEYSEKLDGSIFICRYLREKNEFFTHTSGSLTCDDNDILVGARKMFFADTPEGNAIRIMVKKHPEQTFMFEYISQDNPIVVQYDESQDGLYLIGIRENCTGDYFTYAAQRSLAKRYPGVKYTRTFANKKWEDILEIVKNASGDTMEGFVINIDGHLFKLKTDDYVKLHRFIGNVAGPNRIIKAVADGEFDDIMSKIPLNLRKRFINIAQIAINYDSDRRKKVNDYYNQIPLEFLNNRKDTMLWIEANVPFNYRGDVREKYLGRERATYLKQPKGKDDCKYVSISEIAPNFKDVAILPDDE